MCFILRWSVFFDPTKPHIFHHIIYIAQISWWRRCFLLKIKKKSWIDFDREAFPDFTSFSGKNKINWYCHKLIFSVISKFICRIKNLLSDFSKCNSNLYFKKHVYFVVQAVKCWKEEIYFFIFVKLKIWSEC